MKIAIISDIHGNLHALYSALKTLVDLEFQQLAVLGDLVGYGAYPNECVDFFRTWVEQGKPVGEGLDFSWNEDLSDILARLSNVELLIICGNHDRAVFEQDFRFMNPIAAIALDWTANELSESNRCFINDLSLVKIDGDIYYVHASPDSPEQFNYITGRYHVFQAFTMQKQDICFHGHTHVPVVFQLVGKELKVISDKREILINPDARYLINVGSVGQPRDRDPRGAIAHLDTDTGIYRLIRFDYDLTAAAAAIIAADLPRLCADRLLLGL